MNDRERMIDSVARHAPWMRPTEVFGGPYDGDLTWEKRDPALRICDFCAQSSVGGTLYPCGDFVVHTMLPPQVERPTQIVARGDWGACPACAARIDAGDRDGLLRIMLDARLGAFDAETPPEKREEVRGRQRDNLRRTCAGFWKHRKA
jgi:hypothetical protein